KSIKGRRTEAPEEALAIRLVPIDVDDDEQLLIQIDAATLKSKLAARVRIRETDRLTALGFNAYLDNIEIGVRTGDDPSPYGQILARIRRLRRGIRLAWL